MPERIQSRRLTPEERMGQTSAYLLSTYLFFSLFTTNGRAWRRTDEWSGRPCRPPAISEEKPRKIQTRTATETTKLTATETTKLMAKTLTYTARWRRRASGQRPFAPLPIQNTRKNSANFFEFLLEFLQKSSFSTIFIEFWSDFDEFFSGFR